MKPILVSSLLLLVAAPLSAQRIAEIEPNESAAGAQPIAVGNHVDANLVAGGQDWYSFTLTAAAEVHLQTSGNYSSISSSVDTVAFLFDATGTTRLAWNDNQRGNHSDVGVNLPAGNYTCRVIGKTGTTAGDYGLDLVAYAAAVPTNVEAAEPNGDPALGETPTPIALGGIVTGTLSSPTDEDWYTFTLTGKSLVQAIVSDDGGVPQLDTTTIALRQETAPGVWSALGASSTSAVSHRALTLTHPTTLAAGNYALRISVGSALAGTAPLDYNRAGAYGVRTRVIALPGNSTVAEAPEPNNSPAAAPILAIGDTAAGFISGSNEGDWYGIAVGSPVTIVAISEDGPAPAITDTTIRIWDPTGTTTLATASSGGTGSHGRLIFTINQPGLYYLEVAGGVVASTGNYLLQFGAAPALFVSSTFQQQPPSTNACPGSTGQRPALGKKNAAVPQLGTAFSMRVSNVLPGQFVLTAVGFSNTTAVGGTIPLPVDLVVLGAPGCFMRVDPEIQGLGFADGAGIYTWDLPVPLDYAFLGVSAYAQALCGDPTLNVGGFSVTNDVRLVVGDRGF